MGRSSICEMKLAESGRASRRWVIFITGRIYTPKNETLGSDSCWHELRNPDQAYSAVLFLIEPVREAFAARLSDQCNSFTRLIGSGRTMFEPGAPRWTEANWRQAISSCQRQNAGSLTTSRVRLWRHSFCFIKPRVGESRRDTGIGRGTGYKGESKWAALVYCQLDAGLAKTRPREEKAVRERRCFCLHVR